MNSQLGRGKWGKLVKNTGTCGVKKTTVNKCCGEIKRYRCRDDVERCFLSVCGNEKGCSRKFEDVLEIVQNTKLIWIRLCEWQPPCFWLLSWHSYCGYPAYPGKWQPEITTGSWTGIAGFLTRTSCKKPSPLSHPYSSAQMMEEVLLLSCPGNRKQVGFAICFFVCAFGLLFLITTASSDILRVSSSWPTRSWIYRCEGLESLKNGKFLETKL